MFTYSMYVQYLLTIKIVKTIWRHCVQYNTMFHFCWGDVTDFLRTKFEAVQIFTELLMKICTEYSVLLPSSDDTNMYILPIFAIHVFSYCQQSQLVFV